MFAFVIIRSDRIHRAALEALSVAAIAEPEQRDLIRELLDHAKSCSSCLKTVMSWGFQSVEAFEKYLEEKAWTEYDQVMKQKQKEPN